MRSDEGGGIDPRLHWGLGWPSARFIEGGGITVGRCDYQSGNQALEIDSKADS